MKPKTRLRNEALPVTATQTIASKSLKTKRIMTHLPGRPNAGRRWDQGGRRRQAASGATAPREKGRTRRRAWSTAAAAAPPARSLGDLVQQHQARFSFGCLPAANRQRERRG